MHTGDQADGVTRVLSGQDDMAVTVRPETLSRRLAFLPLQQSPLVLCAPTADCTTRDLLAMGNTQSAAFDWSAVPFIVPERGTTKDMLARWFADQKMTPNIYAQVAGHEAIVAMVGLGLGVGIAPELVVETSGMSDMLSQVALHRPLPVLDIGLCSLQHRLDNPLVQSLWDTARNLG